jgi:hypothetical protein
MSSYYSRRRLLYVYIGQYIIVIYYEYVFCSPMSYVELKVGLGSVHYILCLFILHYRLLLPTNDCHQRRSHENARLPIYAQASFGLLLKGL